MSALVSELPKRNGWTIAEHAGDAVAGPDAAAAEPRVVGRVRGDERGAPVRGRRAWRRRPGGAAAKAGMVIGALDETGQEKHGEATAGVKRQYMGCAGRVANGINTVLRHEAQVCIPRTARRDWR